MLLPVDFRRNQYDVRLKIHKGIKRYLFDVAMGFKSAADNIAGKKVKQKGVRRISRVRYEG